MVESRTNELLRCLAQLNCLVLIQYFTCTGQCYDPDMTEENVVHPLLERELDLVQAVYGQNALETRCVQYFVWLYCY